MQTSLCALLVGLKINGSAVLHRYAYTNQTKRRSLTAVDMLNCHRERLFFGIMNVKMCFNYNSLCTCALSQSALLTNVSQQIDGLSLSAKCYQIKDMRQNCMCCWNASECAIASMCFVSMGLVDQCASSMPNVYVRCHKHLTQWDLVSINITVTSAAPERASQSNCGV